MSPPLLPPELVADILDAFALVHVSHALRAPNLASFARVNRTWHAAAVPLLYRSVYLDSVSRDGILAALESNESLAPLVRRVSLSGGKLDAAGFKRLLDVVGSCKNVTHLSYHCFDNALLDDLTWFVSATWPGLTYLRADQSHALYALLARLPNLETLIASYIEFPAPGVPFPPPSSRVSTPSPPSSGRSSPASETSADHPVVRPTFRLKRFDSGSSPHPHNFHLLTATSTSSLRSLDLPVSSQTSQDLDSFTQLSHLTLTLAERYIHRGGGGRNDTHCLRRVKRLLVDLAAQRSKPVPLSSLEIYEPAHAPTVPFEPASFEEADVLAAVPPSVTELDLATVDIGVRYLCSALERGGDDEPVVCEGLRSVVLARSKRDDDGADGLGEVLRRRGIEVRWA